MQQQLLEQNQLEKNMLTIGEPKNSSLYSNKPVPRKHEKFMEDQQTHEAQRLLRHKQAVARALEREDATFKPQLSKKTVNMAQAAKYYDSDDGFDVAYSRNQPIHDRLYYSMKTE